MPAHITARHMSPFSGKFLGLCFVYIVYTSTSNRKNALHILYIRLLLAGAKDDGKVEDSSLAAEVAAIGAALE